MGGPSIFAAMYALLKPILFNFQAETAHGLTMSTLQTLRKMRLLKPVLRMMGLRPVNKPKEVMGLTFPNVLGMAAGFDKNATYLRELEQMGFGFVEVGTVTPLPQKGNPKPRLFRLPPDQALINRMGFNNEGVEAMVARLKDYRSQKSSYGLIIGGNIGKNKVTPNEEAASDYAKCYEALYPYVDYFVVNVSSPNTPNLRELQDKDQMEKIIRRLDELRAVYRQKHPELPDRPILIKLAPDNADNVALDVLSLVKQYQFEGIVATNTTISRANLKSSSTDVETIGAGGLSGAPLLDRSTEVLQQLRKADADVTLIGVGGILSGYDALAKMEAGADLVQIYSGFIYRGPDLIREVLALD